MQANVVHCMAHLETRGLVGRIYVGDYYILLHTKYIIATY